MSAAKRALESPATPAGKKQRKGFQVGPANLPDGAWRRKNQRIKRELIENAKIKKSYAKLRKRENIQRSDVRFLEEESTERKPGAKDGDALEDLSSEQGERAVSTNPAAGLTLHPDRQQMLDRPRSRGTNTDFKSYSQDANENTRHGPNGPGSSETVPYIGTIREGNSDEVEDEEREKVDDREAFDPRQHPSRRMTSKPQPFSKEIRHAERTRREFEEKAKVREEVRQEKERRLAERERHRRTMAKARTGGRNGQRKLGRESKVLLDKVKRLMGAT